MCLPLSFFVPELVWEAARLGGGCVDTSEPRLGLSSGESRLLGLCKVVLEKFLVRGWMSIRSHVILALAIDILPVLFVARSTVVVRFPSY